MGKKSWLNCWKELVNRKMFSLFQNISFLLWWEMRVGPFIEPRSYPVIPLKILLISAERSSQSSYCSLSFNSSDMTTKVSFIFSSTPLNKSSVLSQPNYAQYEFIFACFKMSDPQGCKIVWLNCQVCYWAYLRRSLSCLMQFSVGLKCPSSNSSQGSPSLVAVNSKYFKSCVERNAM